MNISQQYVDGEWDWVVLNGGGNDLWLGCGCKACARKLEKLISADGDTGEVPTLVRRLAEGRTRVVYIGYLRTPGRNSPIDQCREIGDRFEARIAKMAASRRDVHYLSLQDLVPHGDLSYHAADRVHPSIKGSAAIGNRVADLIRKKGG